MQKMFIVIRQIAFVIILLTLPISDVWSDEGYTLGVVPQFDSRKIASIWNPIIQAIEKESGIRLILIGAPSIPDFEQAFISGKYDFAYMNPYHAVIAHKDAGYQPIIRDTGRKLYGIIVVRKDSPITRLQELNGKTIAFPAPNALGAALIPRMEFSKKIHIDIKPKYVKSHGSVYLNVFFGEVDAGGGVQKTFERQPDKIKNQLRVLYTTSKVEPHPIVVHPRIDKIVVEKFTDAILKLSESEKGNKLLQRIPINKAGKATYMNYKPLENMGLDEFYIQ